ncbi:hypothetical protein ACFSQE_06545 [Vogesella fluminis]|uniref:hypothetical protein n=1 Tax=Vogesella fluminis TaxID=1069161 RepID=UPI0016732E60|nr:hypothetical protein [Vogesella fluminis]
MKLIKAPDGFGSGRCNMRCKLYIVRQSDGIRILASNWRSGAAVQQAQRVAKSPVFAVGAKKCLHETAPHFTIQTLV